MKRVLQRLFEIVNSDSFEFSELQGALIAIIWGIWMLGVGPNSPTGLHISNVISLGLVGFGSIFVGMAQLLSLGFNVLEFRRITCMAAVILWLFLALVDVNQGWRYATTPLLFLFASGAAWAFWRMGRPEYVAIYRDGPVGPRGPQGERGERGPKGEKGERGLNSAGGT
jgi:hypothetical protein